MLGDHCFFLDLNVSFGGGEFSLHLEGDGWWQDGLHWSILEGNLGNAFGIPEGSVWWRLTWSLRECLGEALHSMNDLVDDPRQIEILLFS